MSERGTRQSAKARFQDVDLSGARFRSVDLSGADFRGVNLSRARFRGVDLVDVEVSGEVDGLRVNGVEVAPLVERELDRRHPERTRLRPSDPDGCREAWRLLERLWDEAVERARRLDSELLHESVDGEWSFVETLRHLVFATDSWLNRAILGESAPWDPRGLPWDEMPDIQGVPRDRSLRPSLDEMLELRRDRQSRVRDYLTGLDASSLAADAEPPVGPGWPPEQSFPVRECLLCIFNEEWQHRLYALRDLAELERRVADSAQASRTARPGGSGRPPDQR